MTKLEQTLRRLFTLPPERQDEVAEVLEQIMDLNDEPAVPAWQLEELKCRLALADDFADDAEVAEAFRNQ